MRGFALNVDGMVTMLVIVRIIPLFFLKRQAELSLLKLKSANSDSQVLIVLRSGKETRVTLTYGKKEEDSANKGH